MQTAEKWFKDIPQQFLGKKNIGVLVNAFARQLQEARQVFEDLNTKLDVDTALGRNLDYVGTIIPLSRKEAAELVNRRFHEPVISDERYRQYLMYKMLQNTSDCTYYDIMKAIEILWDADKAFYYERADRPATVFIGLPLADIEDDDYAHGKPDIMKPGGVGLIYVAEYSTLVEQCRLETARMPALDIHSYFRFLKCRMGMAARIGVNFRHKEQFKNSLVTVRKDLWYLDGSYQLDGTKCLDAELREEEL